MKNNGSKTKWDFRSIHKDLKLTLKILVSQTSSYSLSSMMNSYSFHQSSNTTPKSKSRDYYSSPNTDLIYRCPVVECGKAGLENEF